MQSTMDTDTITNDTSPLENAHNTKDDDNATSGVLLTTEDTSQQLMVASKLIKLAQRLPSVKPRTTAEQDAAQLRELTIQTHNNLFESKPVALFIFNVNSISIDRQKVTVTRRSLFKVRQTVSIQIVDIINVQASAGLLYGSLTITSKHFLNNIQNVSNLSRDDVIRARRLLQGLIIACQAKVDITKIETTKLLQMLDDLGKENHTQGRLG